MTSAGAVRIGVIGRGFGASVVAPVFQETDGCEVVDVVTPRDPDAVRALCARDDVDLIAVHSPPFLHLDHVRWAVDAGHAVLCDKPMGRSAAEATTMLDLASAAGVVHLCNYEFRFHPTRQRLRALLHDGVVGAVEHVQWTAFLTASRAMPYGWLFDRELGGGWVGASGSHVIDCLHWMFGPVARVRAELRTTVTERTDPDGTVRRCTAEDAYSALLRMESDVTVLVDGSLVSPVGVPQTVTVMGADGAIESVADQRITVRTADGVRDEYVFDPEGRPSPRVAMEHWARVVRDAVRDGDVTEGTPTFFDGVACARVMDQMRA